MKNRSLSEMMRTYFAAYESKDRVAIEAVVGDDFTFTSPRDDHIDRAAYFERCWPNSEKTKQIDIQKLFEQGDEAFVLYELHPTSGQPFRNAEFFRMKNGRIHSVEVFFGSTVGTAEDL